MSSIHLMTRAKLSNNEWRFDPATGFLRCTATINITGVMTYLRSEFPPNAIPPNVAPGRNELRVYLPADVLAVPESLESLEGKPAIVGHTWVDTTVREGTISCGQIAGSPTFDGLFVNADILITDPLTVGRVMLPVDDPERLEEISSAGDWLVAWIPGQTVGGEAYDGVFARVVYNHVALLPKGAGRAGAPVRIINQVGTTTMTDFTRIKLRSGHTVRVHNEDVAAVEDNDKKADAEVKNAETTKIDPAKLQETLDRVAELSGQIDELSKERDTLTGQLQALQEELAKATDPATVDAAAAEEVQESEIANRVMNAHRCDPSTLKGLRGHARRVAVVSAVRAMNKAPALDAKQIDNEGFINGMFSTMADTAVVPAVPGRWPQPSTPVTIQNQGGQQEQKPVSHFERLYAPAAKA